MAIGRGTGLAVYPGQSLAEGRRVTVTVVALDIGTCDGKTAAYRAVTWFSPADGDAFLPERAVDACLD